MSRKFVEEKDIVFKLDKTIQTTTDGSSLSDLPRVAGPPVRREAWNEGWRPPVPIIHDTVMNRFRMRGRAARRVEEADGRGESAYQLRATIPVSNGYR